jgi:hypothetical protein
MTLRAARSRPASSARRAVSTGRCSATSSATASAAMHAGPPGEANTRRARPPINAERTTFASATTTLGSEIAENLLLSHASRLALLGNLRGEAAEHLSLHVSGKLRCLPRQEEAGRASSPGYEDDVVGAEHLARAIPKVSNSHDFHVVTVVDTTTARKGPAESCQIRSSLRLRSPTALSRPRRPASGQRTTTRRGRSPSGTFRNSGRTTRLKPGACDAIGSGLARRLRIGLAPTPLAGRGEGRVPALEGLMAACLHDAPQGRAWSSRLR